MNKGVKQLSWSNQQLVDLVTAICGTALHATTVRSLAAFTVGLLGAESMTLHRIGAGMAGAYGGDPKHATKQIDRFLTKSKLPMDTAFQSLCDYLLGGQRQAMVAMDWTEFDHDDHSTLAIYLLTAHGRALPLLWETHQKSTIAEKRTAIELDLVRKFVGRVPQGCDIILMADRGFGYQELVEVLHEVGIDFVLRVRSNVFLTNSHGETRLTSDWLHPSGRARMLRGVAITRDQTEVEAFVAVKAKGMKEPWYLVTSLSGLTADSIVKLYGKRFSIEETFRDQKDDRFGLGLRATRIRSAGRRDRLLLICALAYLFIVQLGQAGEDAGLDRLLKVNTSKRRQLSLFNQGLRWLMLLQTLRADRKELLLEAFVRRLEQSDFAILVLQHIEEAK